MEGLVLIATVAAVFFVRLAQNAVGTLRDILVVKGERRKAAVYSFIEVSLWLAVFSFVLRGIFDEPFSVKSIAAALAFAAGFAGGSYFGIFIEERMALGYNTVQVISIDKSKKIGKMLRAAGFPATVIKGRGMKGPREIYQSVIPRRQLSRFLALVDRMDPKAFITVMDTRSVVRGKTKVR